MFLRKFPALLLVLALCARAQEPLNSQVPLAPAEAPTMSPGEMARNLVSARTAQELGMNSRAISLYRELLSVRGGDQAEVILNLATVLLDDGQAVEAERVLQSYSGTRGAAWHLRAGLAAALQRKVDATRGEFEAIKPEELSKADASWFQYLQGMLTNLTDPTNHAKANAFYKLALDTAVTDLARARFQIALDQSRLRIGAATEADIALMRQGLERLRGRTQGYEIASILAKTLDANGQKGKAVELLQEQLRWMVQGERAWADDFRLLLGMIGGATNGVGRNALFYVLEPGGEPGRQRIALQLLARASQAEPGRRQFRTELTRLINATPAPRILEDLLLFRAQAALASKTMEGRAQAEDDANELRQKFPGSPLLAHAYAVLTTSAWEQNRFRIAADHATKARDALPPGNARAEIGVLVAEAWFRAGRAARAEGADGARDFRLAADAYAAALQDPPPGTPRADLIFQRVLAELESGTLESAQTLLDELATDPAFDLKSRWQAEWNLARSLQAAGKTTEAFARVSRLLSATPGANPELDPALRAKMAWLQARLSFDPLEPSEQTLKFIEDLGRSLEGVDQKTRDEILSTGALLRAQTNFALKRDAAAKEDLESLRKLFPTSPAAIYSYIVEANRLAEQDQAANAQKLLTKLAEDFPENEYAPYALYLAAEQAERRGQSENYAEALRRIEDLIALVAKYPPKDSSNNLIFAARLKQGDILQKLAQFSQAQDAYQFLIHNYPQHGDVIYAQLALAKSYNAQSASDPALTERAQALFEHLLARLDAPLDVRVEAGYNYGNLLARRGAAAQALDIWWRDVVQAFLIDEKVAVRLGATGRYFMARTLLDSADLLERLQKLEEAKTMWQLVLRTNLPGQAWAKKHLARFNLAEAAP
jgi:tetratricopeptide (TPR) repeat protein